MSMCVLVLYIVANNKYFLFHSFKKKCRIGFVVLAISLHSCVVVFFGAVALVARDGDQKGK